MKRAFLVAVAGALLLHALIGSRASAQASSTDALKFFKNYFVTGDYVVGGVGLRGLGNQNQLATATIHINGGAANVRAIPENAEIAAAFLFWQTVVTDQHGSGTTGAAFRGNDISGLAVELNPNGTAPCWSSGGGTGGADGGAHVMKAYRADVLRYLPTLAGRPVADDIDVAASGQTGLEVTLPDSGQGNAVPATAGASLVVVFSTYGGALRSVVLYNGGFTLNQGHPLMSQRIKGFYQAADAPQAKLTHIVGNGQENFPELLTFNTADYGSPFVGALGGSWDNPTIDVTAAMSIPVTPEPPNSGQNAITTVAKTGNGTSDCLSWGAIVFSTTVQDSDGDGLLDIWENAWPVDGANQPIPLVDPTGVNLPNLNAMGAHSNHKDLFVEVAAMYTLPADPNANPPRPGTTYGSGAAAVTDNAGHNHMPLKSSVLDKVGQSFAAAGVDVHFDVGNLYQTNPADPYIVPASYARGGEQILETACVPDTQDPPRWTCRFPDWPGTVGWKIGFQYFKDAPVGPLGEQLTADAELACENDATCAATTRRRFDRIRKDMFHLGMFVHSQGNRKSEDPTSPDYNVPTRSSGVGDYPGGDFMVSLGAWGYLFRGPEFVQASTLMHEAGHNLWRGHSGDPFNPFEKNCNPQFLSVMNYMYQIQGLSLNGTPTLDFARPALANATINENSLPAGFGSTAPYFLSWYAPLSTVHQSLGSTAATSHCNGTPLLGTDVPMVRITASTTQTAPSIPAPPGTIPVDWNGDLNTSNDYGLQMDVSFDGAIHNGGVDPAQLLRGADDWTNIAGPQATGLQQLGSRRNIDGLSLDVGRTDSGRTDSGRTDSGRTDSGRTDSGRTDSGKEQDLELALSVRYPPTELSASYSAITKVVTVIWQPPTLVPEGTTVRYQVFRVLGDALTSTNFGKRYNVGQTTSLSIVDNKAKAGDTYTYFAVAKYGDGATGSPQSNLFVITIPR